MTGENPRNDLASRLFSRHRMRSRLAARLALLVVLSLVLHVLAAPLVEKWLLSGDASPSQVVHRVELRMEDRIVPVEEEPPPIHEPLAEPVPNRSQVPEPLTGPVPPQPSPSLMSVQPSIAPVSVTIPRWPEERTRRAAVSSGVSPRESRSPDVKDSPESFMSPTAQEAIQEAPLTPPDGLLEGLPGGMWRVRAPTLTMTHEEQNEVVVRVHRAQRYPREALERGSEGRVIVRFRLDMEGLPRDVTVQENPSESETLAREAMRMVREAGPYPAPRLRREAEGFLAVAAYWDGVDARLFLVRSSGNPQLDELGLQAARQACKSQGEGEWLLHRFEFKATYEIRGGDDGQCDLVQFEGDPALRPFFVKQAPTMARDIQSSEFLLLPVQFHIEEDW